LLVLAGAGVHPGSVSAEVAEAVSRADAVYVDSYTMPGVAWLVEWARRHAPDRIVVASREALESGAPRIAEEARDGLVVVLVPGDPLIATTHISLLAEASARGVEWRVIPGVSGVVSAKTLSGLQYYRFGRTITIPGPWRGVKAVSIVAQLYGNLCVGLHTLLLLDVSEEGRQLDPAAGAAELSRLEEELAGEVGFDPILHRLMAAVVERAGTPEASVYWGRLAGIRAGRWREPSSIVLPGIIHGSEADMIMRVYGVGDDVVRSHNRIVLESRARACRVYEALSL
jgi:diphthine synthase